MDQPVRINPRPSGEYLDRLHPCRKARSWITDARRYYRRVFCNEAIRVAATPGREIVGAAWACLWNIGDVQRVVSLVRTISRVIWSTGITRSIVADTGW